MKFPPLLSGSRERLNAKPSLRRFIIFFYFFLHPACFVKWVGHTGEPGVLGRRRLVNLAAVNVGFFGIIAGHGSFRE